MVLIVEREAAIKIEMQQPKCLESFECLSARVLTHILVSLFYGQNLQKLKFGFEIA